MASADNNKLIIFSAPSGSGKTTIVKALLERVGHLEFSISATSRAPRGNEQHGVDYYFLTPQAFRDAIASDEFVEWEEVYTDTYYGTLHSELNRIWAKGNTILFDVDVMGGIHLKQLFGERACSIFIEPPSIEELRNRLCKRATDSAETIEKRVAKAAFELAKAPEFDHVILNDDLQHAIEATEQVVREFIGR
jgi:guanylate kinase